MPLAPGGLTARQVYYGSPASDDHQPERADVVRYSEGLEAEIEAAVTGLVRAATLAEMPDGTRVGQPGEVTEGVDRGAYAWDGASWERVGDLIDPESVAESIAAKANQAEVDEISGEVARRVPFSYVGASKIGRKVAAWAANNIAFLSLDEFGRLGFIRDTERRINNALGGYQYAQVASGRVIWGILRDGLFFIPSLTLLVEFAKRLHLEPPAISGVGSAPIWGVERLSAALLRFQGEVAGAVRGYIQRAGDTGFISEAGPVIDLILTSGQSTDSGFVAAGEKIATTAKYPGHAMMFNSGIRGPFNNSALVDSSFASLVAAEEVIVSNNGETGGVAMLRLLTEMRRVEGDVDNASIYRCHGVNGYRVDQLNKTTNSGPYRNTVLAASSAKRLADDYNRQVVCRAVYWSQGQADQAKDPATYEAELTQIAADYDADIRAATGQSESVLFVMDPPPTSSLGTEFMATLTQYRLQRDNPLFRISAPGYIVRLGDGIHYMAPYYGLRGEYRAKVQRALERGLEWTPLRPVPDSPISRVGSTLTLSLEGGVGDLVVDTDKCPEQPNYGFVYEDDVSSAVIQSVTVNGSARTITIELSAEPTGSNRRLYYAWKHNGDDDLTRPGAMGNIFDSDQTPSLMEIAEFPTLQNPLITFEESVP